MYRLDRIEDCAKETSVGNKPLVDTPSPVVRALEQAEHNRKSLPEALSDFERAAKEGMDRTFSKA